VIAHNGAIPVDYRITVVTIPDYLPIETVGLENLIEGWPEGDSEATTAEYGTLWAGSLRTAVLRVPSAAIRAEHNYILNPLHPNFREIRFEAPDTEHIDHRLMG
jgi:RES domain-containing protein